MPNETTADRIGFTGTRKGLAMDQQAALAAILARYHGSFHHGDCIGADKQAHEIVRSCGYSVTIHAPVKSNLRAWCKGDVEMPPRGYLDRNRDIVDTTQRLIAALAGMAEEHRSGTWSTVRYAMNVGKPVSIVFPDGSVRTIG
jgi:hypothetical protein